MILKLWIIEHGVSTLSLLFHSTTSSLDLSKTPHLADLNSTFQRWASRKEKTEPGFAQQQDQESEEEQNRGPKPEPPTLNLTDSKRSFSIQTS